MRGAPLDEREQRYAYLGAGLGAAVSIALYAPAFDEPAAWALAGIGVAMSGLLAAAARTRGRLLTMGACLLLSFGPWGFAWIVGLPYLVLGAWLVVRGSRLAPAASAPPPRRRRRQRAPDAEEDRPVPAPPPRPAAPRASKRYTPPRGRS